ncbi:hypothetical protein QR680_018908 [Steinernema hermaphroditum]|uniref:Uncharacterized protein n=1 Tax=Steinernema hermaphroditum TaxID=289476 RepID=A0AA39LR28_9BILA|nr:hypothetical protein QR680_018908 [Steinernema hermaphroditum]
MFLLYLEYVQDYAVPVDNDPLVGHDLDSIHIHWIESRSNFATASLVFVLKVMQARPKHPALIRIRPEYKNLQQFLETKYEKFHGRIAYPVMSFNFLAVADGRYCVGGAEIDDGVFGARFTLRHGVIDVFHVHDISWSDPVDVRTALRSFLEKALQGEPIICAEGQREPVARFVVRLLGGDFEKVLESVHTILEVEISLLSKCCDQYRRHYGKYEDELLIFKEFLDFKRHYSSSIMPCCRMTAQNAIFDIYHMCRMAQLSSNIYQGDVMPPGPHMFALLYAYRGQMCEEAHNGNRLWDSDGTASSLRERRNNDPLIVESPQTAMLAKTEQGDELLKSKEKERNMYITQLNEW